MFFGRKQVKCFLDERVLNVFYFDYYHCFFLQVIFIIVD